LEKCTVREIAAWSGGEIFGDDTLTVGGITTDSRSGGDDALFIALKGERFDGNAFAEDFLRRGTAVMTERRAEPPPGKAVIVVDDTRKALRDAARRYRERFEIPVVGVTGSVGKTSTKDMIASVLSRKFNTLKTQGNFNNEIGLPLTVFNLTREHQCAVLEMGMNRVGEISRLTAIARPAAAVITNIGTAHIGNLGSRRNILKAKLEILEKLEPGGIVALNGDDKMLYALKGRLPHRVIYYGIDNLKADVVATDLVLGNDKSKFKTEVNGETRAFEINAVGQHHIYNALAAIIIGLYYNVQDVAGGVAAFTAGGMRQNIIKIGGVTLIEDCYNASAASMEAALKVLSQLSGANRAVAVLGDILEQGAYAEKTHRQVGAAVAAFEIGQLVTVGKDARYIADEARQRGVSNIVSFDGNAEAARYLEQEVRQGDTVLCKASRGMRFEEISAALQASLCPQNPCDGKE
jgi:UDP-N-acetylmuramoyl-tripeptide--D-alanyl-D-alanine ligase